MQKITPFLWFNGNAEEAANFYVSVFRDSKILETRRYGEGAPAPAGSVLSVTIELEGQQLVAFNGGPHFKFNEAISLFVNCESQAEVDELWDKLGSGGQPVQCGWLKDKFGLVWQIVPKQLGEYLSDPDQDKSRRVMQAMMQMVKLDLEKLKRAYEGG